MAVTLWLFSFLFLTVGTFVAIRRKKPKPLEKLPPITVLKPLCGTDPGLEKNLECFFRQTYPEFELIFSAADGRDPAVNVAMNLMKAFPKVKARIVVGSAWQGLNPKVNNLTEAYQMADYETILVSDSNIRPAPGYLKNLACDFSGETGVLTSIVAGTSPNDWGGMLEATYLNTFYARAMHLAFFTGSPFVIGKSMLFRKETLERMGGWRALSGFIAEDYAFGEKVLEQGLKIGLASEPVPQYIGDYSFGAFWRRHTRWGKIRKSHAPWIFLLEPLSMAVPASILAGWALSPLLPFAAGFTAYFTLAMVCDRWVSNRVSMGGAPFRPFHWCLRELLALPLWIASALSNSVNWRGHELEILPGGLIEVRQRQWNGFFGERLRARTRWKAITRTAIGGIGRKRAMLREG